MLSVTLYVTSYVPTSFIFTVFFIIFASVNTIFPSSSSSAVTPANGLNSSPTCNTLSSAFIVGTLFNCSILGFTVTVIVLTADAPLLSVILYVTSYVPASFIFTVFFIIFASVNTIFPSSSSSAVTPANGLNSSPTCNTLSSAFIVGAWFSSVEFKIHFAYSVTLCAGTLSVSKSQGFSHCCSLYHPANVYPTFVGSCGFSIFSSNLALCPFTSLPPCELNTTS